ncbi:MAG: SBBP repeat-containing protein [Chitinophagales bacterium]
MNRFWVCLIFFATWTTTVFAQDVEWLAQAGGSKYDSGMDISIDKDFNSLVVGIFSDTLQLEGVELASLGGTDLFIAKYDATGVLQWANQAGSKANDEAYGVDTDSDGNVYITGYFRDTIDFEGNKLYAADLFDDDIFIAKYEADGTLAWVKQLGGTGSDIGYGIAVDAAGNAYVTGRFSERFTAPIGDNGMPFTFISKGTFDIFVAKYDTNGQRMWIRQYGGDHYDSAQAIVLDNDNHYYLTGFFNGTTKLGENSLMSNGDFDLFAAKFDESGTVLWANNAGGAYTDLGVAMDIDASGNAYITGSYEDTAYFGEETITSVGSTDFYVAKLHTDGTFAWVRQGGGNDSDIGLGIAADANGNSHITGVFSEMFVIEEDTLEANSSNTGAIFLLQYNSEGVLQWTTNTTGGSYDEGTAIVIDENSNCYLTGSFSRSINIGGNILNSNGSSDLFVAKIKGNITDIEEAISGHSAFLQIYPNPVSRQLFIEFEAETSDVYSLQLSDYAGRVVFEQFFENTQGTYEQVVDVSSFAKGLYLLQMKSNKMSITKKLMVN